MQRQKPQRPRLQLPKPQQLPRQLQVRRRCRKRRRPSLKPLSPKQHLRLRSRRPRLSLPRRPSISRRLPHRHPKNRTQRQPPRRRFPRQLLRRLLRRRLHPESFRLRHLFSGLLRRRPKGRPHRRHRASNSARPRPSSVLSRRRVPISALRSAPAMGDSRTGKARHRTGSRRTLRVPAKAPARPVPRACLPVSRRPRRSQPTSPSV